MSESRRTADRREAAEPRPGRVASASNRLHARTENEAFFRQVVTGMRNGVLAITRQGVIALINDEAYRICGMEPRSDDVGRPVGEVLRQGKNVC